MGAPIPKIALCLCWWLSMYMYLLCPSALGDVIACMCGIRWCVRLRYQYFLCLERLQFHASHLPGWVHPAPSVVPSSAAHLCVQYNLCNKHNTVTGVALVVIIYCAKNCHCLVLFANDYYKELVLHVHVATGINMAVIFPNLAMSNILDDKVYRFFWAWYNQGAYIMFMYIIQEMALLDFVVAGVFCSCCVDTFCGF